MTNQPAGQSGDAGAQVSDGSLREHVVVITGGASGIGRATAEAFSRRGARAVVADIDRDRIDQTIAELDADGGGAGRHLGLTCDVSSESDVESMASQTLDRYGRIDTLVASAGVLRGPGSVPKPLVNISPDEWDYVLRINLTGMFLSNRAVLPTMIEQRGGNIVNISSVSGKQGRAHDGPYSASKFGVIGLSEALAEEVRSFGIRVQVVIPDAVDTPIWDQNGPIPRPPVSLPPERVAELIFHLVTLPPDTILPQTVIAPFRSRKRKKDGKRG